MRLFVAIEIPDALRALVAELVSKIREALPPSKWVKPENYHLTLRFLGEVREEEVDRLKKRLDAISDRHRSFSLQLDSAGTFPAKRPARVAWIGLTDSSALETLTKEVHSETAEFVEARNRPTTGQNYSPHLTVARPRRPWPRSASEVWQRGLTGPIGEPFLVSRCVLVRSRLGPGGARYDVLHEAPLQSV